MSKPVTILSMLHEPAGRNSATRLFRDEPVLAWTQRRLGRPARVLCWEDQAAAARAAGADVCSRGARQSIGPIETVAAARRWADGWRGGLLGTCEFDRGFYGPWMLEIQQKTGADGVLLVDPAAGLVDPALIDGLLAHADSLPDVDLCFSPAAPGLSGVLVRPSLLEKLAAGKTHPGVLLSYRPDIPRRDPISEPACAPIPVPLARTTRRFTLDSESQIARLTSATAHLNGQLISIDAMGLLATLEKTASIDPLPRELVMELNTRRATEPIYWPGGQLAIEREPISLERAERLLRELSRRDDARLVLAGVGDPLLHEGLAGILAAAHSAGITAISVETDFVGASSANVSALAASAVDIVSVHLPAATAATYRAVMGTDALAEAIDNLRLFMEKRQSLGRQTPLLAPTFTKCQRNLAEMEAWYDHWQRTLGCAVVTGPSDFAGLIPDVSAADMSPPRRRPCVSLHKRLMALSDGTIVSCEQDVTARQPLGTTIETAWQAAQTLRDDHNLEQWNAHPACASCKQWHRP